MTHAELSNQYGTIEIIKENVNKIIKKYFLYIKQCCKKLNVILYNTIRFSFIMFFKKNEKKKVKYGDNYLKGLMGLSIINK